MRLFSYVVARDYGFAPNPFFGVCTLATCKPEIRRIAAVGDWIVGTGSKARDRDGRLVYLMRVSEILTYDDYWRDLRFYKKRPNLQRSLKYSFGDNIYFREKTDGPWNQVNSHHSLQDGQPNFANIMNDTKSANVLIGVEYAYWGGDGPEIPRIFRSFDGLDICKSGRGHKSRFPNRLVASFLEWFHSLEENGCLGVPLDWTGK